MESRFGLWQGVSALYSESGRQLGEENTRPFALNHHIPAETIQCKYEGSRKGRKINMSALRIAMGNFDAALAITSAVREFHLSKSPVPATVGIWDLYVIARSSIALIAYQLRKRPNPNSSGTIGDALSSQYQFISGIFMICRDLIEKGDDRIVANAPMSAHDLYAHADEAGIFISFNGMACAGSAAKIMQFLNFCNDGGLGNTQNLIGIVGDAADWYRYAIASIEMDCFIEIERCKRSRDDLKKRAKIAAAISQYSRILSPDLPHFNGSADFETALLERQNTILAILGRSPIAALRHAHIAARLEV
ncbi:MAG: hypothetical protein ABJP70_06730 [Erythrobacter sp.]